MLSNRQFEQARQYIDNIQAEFNFTPHSKSLYAALLLIKGFAAFCKHEYQVALENIETGINYDKNNIDLHFAKIHMHLTLLQYDKMLPSIEQAIVLEKVAKDRFLSFRSFLTYQLGDVAESLSSANQALSLNPDNSKALYTKTKCLLSLSLLNENIESELSGFITRNAHQHANVISLISARSEVRFKMGKTQVALMDAEYVIQNKGDYLNRSLIPNFNSLLSTEKEGEILENAFLNHLRFKFLIDARIIQLESLLRLGNFEFIANNTKNILPELNYCNQYVLQVLKLRRKLHCYQEEEFTNDFYLEEQLYVFRSAIKYQLLFAEANVGLNNISQALHHTRHIHKLVNNLNKQFGITGFYSDGIERTMVLERKIRLHQAKLQASNSFAEDAASFDSVQATLFSQSRKQKREDDDIEKNEREKLFRKK
jgi:hypothetical protein